MDREEHIVRGGPGGRCGREDPQGPEGWTVHTLGLILELEVFCTDSFLWTQSQVQSIPELGHASGAIPPLPDFSLDIKASVHNIKDSLLTSLDIGPLCKMGTRIFCSRAARRVNCRLILWDKGCETLPVPQGS